MLQKERNINFLYRFRMSDIPCQGKIGTVQQILYCFFLVAAKAVCIFNDNFDVRISYPCFARHPKNFEIIHIHGKIPVIHLDLFIRKCNIDSMMHMHIDCKWLVRISEHIFKGQHLLCHLNGSSRSLQVRFSYQWIKIRNIQVLIQMNGVIDSSFLCRMIELPPIFQLINLIFRKIHIQFDKIKAQFLTK